MSVIVFAEIVQGHYKRSVLETVSYAKRWADVIGEPLTVVALNPQDPSETLYKYGASKVVKIKSDETRFIPSNELVGALARYFEAGRYIIFSHTIEGSVMAARLAVSLKLALTTNVLELPAAFSPLIVRKKCFSGKAFMDVRLEDERGIFTLMPNAFGVHESPVDGVEIEEEITGPEIPSNVKIEQIEKRDDAVIDLKEAEIVVSGGRGLKGSENWTMIEELARLLGAATACSKPVADMGWRPHGEHVGQTGKAIAPNLYIAIGISGAIQHLAGVNASKNIVVINTDAEAPFFKAADYGIVGDAFEVVPALIENIRQMKEKLC